jgi:hypothetical protein
MRSYKFPKMFNTNSSRIWREDEYNEATRQNALRLPRSPAWHNPSRCERFVQSG